MKLLKVSILRIHDAKHGLEHRKRIQERLWGGSREARRKLPRQEYEKERERLRRGMVPPHKRNENKFIVRVFFVAPPRQESSDSPESLRLRGFPGWIGAEGGPGGEVREEPRFETIATTS